MIQYSFITRFGSIVIPMLCLGFGIVKAQPEVDSEPTAETEIICYAAQKQWVCAPADQKQQAHDKAIKLAEQNQSTDTESEFVGDSSVEIKTMDTNENFNEQVLENPPDQLFQPDSVAQQTNDFAPRTDASELNESVAKTAMATEVIVESPQSQIATDQVNVNETETVPALSRSPESNRSSNNFKDWQVQHADKWSFQVVGAANRKQLAGFINLHNLQQRNHAIAKTQVNDADWWIVLVGLFNSRDEALHQRSQLPSELADQAWVRQVKTISAQAD